MGASVLQKQFSEVLGSVIKNGDGWTAAVSDDWLQGRSTFGGLQAALALRAMRGLVPATLSLRSLQVAFVAPVSGGAVRITARVLREGKNVIQVEARLLEGEETACLVIGVFENLFAAYVSTAFKDTFAFGIIIVVLMFRPQGLFTRRVAKKV